MVSSRPSMAELSKLQHRRYGPQNLKYLHGSKVISWRRQWHPTPVLLPGKSYEQRSLVGCSPWGRWESDMTEQLHFHFSLSCIGEGNGNPHQCSCLENPRDGGAWWAAIYGVAQSQTRLKWLSSSSSRDLLHSLACGSFLQLQSTSLKPFVSIIISHIWSSVSTL